jgi:serine phosphatase RsbU (regulator of sigma subunit)
MALREEFGQERLAKLLTASAGRTEEEMADLILSTVRTGLRYRRTI